MMASRNVETLETFFKAPSPDALYNLMAENCVYRDHSLGQVYEGRDAVRGWARAWAGAASNLHTTDVWAHEAGDVVVVQAMWRGTNDGAFGPYPATGQSYAMPTCYIFHFDSDGRIVENEVYYCKLRLLEQLGLADSEDTHPAGQGPDLPS
jgi:steroid delta-isomerase-like uncharacterized protein